MFSFIMLILNTFLIYAIFIKLNKLESFIKKEPYENKKFNPHIFKMKYPQFITSGYTEY